MKVLLHKNLLLPYNLKKSARKPTGKPEYLISIFSEPTLSKILAQCFILYSFQGPIIHKVHIKTLPFLKTFSESEHQDSPFILSLGFGGSVCP